MENSKTIGEWERELGRLFTQYSGDELLTEITETQALELLQLPTTIGVNWDDRIEFLTNNGYPITRANLVDSSLSTKPQA